MDPLPETTELVFLEDQQHYMKRRHHHHQQQQQHLYQVEEDEEYYHHQDHKNDEEDDEEEDDDDDNYNDFLLHPHCMMLQKRHHHRGDAETDSASAHTAATSLATNSSNEEELSLRRLPITPLTTSKNTLLQHHQQQQQQEQQQQEQQQEEQQHRRTTRLTFSDTVVVYETISRWDMTDKEKRRSYYSAEDFYRMHERALRKAQDDDRGLVELYKLTSEGLAQADERVTTAVRAVLHEQARQSCFGICDPQGIARVYQTVSAECQTAAHQLAHYHASKANKVYRQLFCYYESS